MRVSKLIALLGEKMKQHGNVRVQMPVGEGFDFVADVLEMSDEKMSKVDCLVIADDATVKEEVDSEDAAEASDDEVSDNVDED